MSVANDDETSPILPVAAEDNVCAFAKHSGRVVCASSSFLCPNARSRYQASGVLIRSTGQQRRGRVFVLILDQYRLSWGEFDFGYIDLLYEFYVIQSVHLDESWFGF